ncbi:MAG: peptidyl-prolyl cis-trans isomerase [Thermodesulfobacteriota bacterium]
MSDLPLVGGKPALASINGEPLFLEEFDRVLQGLHGDMADNTQKRAIPHPSELLERLINAKLVLQEAHNIGLDELPEIKAAEKSFAEQTLRGMLYGFQVRNIRTADPKEVEKRYREAVKEVKVSSLLFAGEAEAKRLAEEVKAGGKFELLAAKRIAAGEAKGSAKGEYLKFSSLTPDVAKVVARMKNGEVSPPIRIGNQYSLLKLEGVRYPKDNAARKQAENAALQAKKTAALEAYAKGLRKKYARIDRKVLDQVDYEAEGASFDKFRADQRVVATVKGEKPLTVAALTAAIEKKFFHGAERAAERKKINRRKEQVLEDILDRQVALKEAKIQKLERTEFFRVKAEENRNGLLFGAFVQKVIASDVKVTEEELKSYYMEHAADYAYPEMARIDSLAFTDRTHAENAIGKLRSGADLQWLRANADGQADPAKVKNLLDLKGQMLELSGLPAGVKEAVLGAQPGEYRLYTDPAAAHYVLVLRERVPSRPIPLESVKSGIEKKVYNEKTQRVLRDWEGKLRKASEVKIFATGKKLDRIVNPGAR